MKLTEKRTLVALLVGMMIMLAAAQVLGVTGATITYNSTDLGPTQAADGHTANRSTITTLVLSSIQQDQNWKAYVGNVSGTLTLDDANDNTIYDWPDAATFTGEVFATRFAGVDMNTLSCAAVATQSSENLFFNMTDDQVDSINNTFNSTAHAGFIAGGQSLSNCPSTSLYVSDTRTAQSATADFQEILTEDTNNYMVFVSLLNDDTTGFDDNNYDFQLIVPESDVNATPATYYFYLELSS